MREEKKSIGRTVRPIFIPNRNSIGVIEQEIEFNWYMGMSLEVRRRSIRSFHEKAKEQGFNHILEASSKSEQEIGIQLSAFFLKKNRNNFESRTHPAAYISKSSLFVSIILINYVKTFSKLYHNCI